MKTLSIEVNDIFEGKIKISNSISSSQTFLRHEHDYILVDDFDSNKTQLEMTEITIVENGKILFKGNKYELFKKLSDEN